MPDNDPPQQNLNLKQLLLARNHWFAQEIMAGVRASNYAFITDGQSRLLAHMGGKPMRMTELARRLGISRQAVHKSVNELIRRGILELRDDPNRANARLVAYTPRGKELNRGGARIIEDIERRIAEAIGAKGLSDLKALLSKDWSLGASTRAPGSGEPSQDQRGGRFSRNASVPS